MFHHYFNKNQKQKGFDVSSKNNKAKNFVLQIGRTRYTYRVAGLTGTSNQQVQPVGECSPQFLPLIRSAVRRKPEDLRKELLSGVTGAVSRQQNFSDCDISVIF